MTRTYQIEVVLPEDRLRFSGNRSATTLEPSDFNLGKFPLNVSLSYTPFLLEDKGEQVLLPEHFINNCGAPLRDAIRLSNAARLYQHLLKNNQPLGDVKVTSKAVEMTYGWANEGWENVSRNCFRQDYEQSVAFRPFVRLFNQEAKTALN